MERPNSGRRINTGDMRLDQFDCPAWETLYETTYYQMRGGCSGIVHEGRYQLADFDKAIVMPFGFIASMESRPWVHALGSDPTKSAPLQSYRRLMEHLMAAVHDAYDRNEDIDIAVDDGQEITRYRKVVRITDKN